MSPARPRRALLVLAIAAGAVPWAPGPRLVAQTMTTAAVHGAVRTGDGEDADGARVTVRNTATGVALEAEVRDGRFFVQGLEVGGPYAITVERLGYRAERREGLVLGLGEPLELEFVLRTEPIPLDTLRVDLAATLPRSNVHGGTATTIADSLLHRLPSLDRDFYDFVRLVPQVSTKIGFGTGLSGGGVGFRFNNFLINGVGERTIFASSTPALAGGKSLPFDAVKEYQVLVAPYDVRYGDFAGALVNTVTRSGTNDLVGSAFAYWRNDRLAGDELGSIAPYDRTQYGFTLGGPIVRDRLHFFVAPEFQRLTSPAPGPYVGQPPGANPPVPVREADLARADDILGGYGLEAGSGGPVENENPLTNAFARLDLAMPAWNTRAVLWSNTTRNTASRFARDEREVFPLSTYQVTQRSETGILAAQVQTALERFGGHNELVVSHKWERGRNLSDVEQPVVRVSVPSPSGGAVTLNTGTHELAQGTSIRTSSFQVRDELTLPWRDAHVVTLGAVAERFRIRRQGVLGAFGTWSFSSLDSLELGLPERYELRQDFGSASAPISGGLYAVYLGDRWRAAEDVTVTLGLRGDWLVVDERAPYNPVVDSIFGRRTDRMPDSRLHLSPRLGFTWDVSGAGRDRVRGGIGVFTGRPPVAWLLSALSSYGVGIGALRCGDLPSDAGPPPAFDPDPHDPPTSCGGGSGAVTAPRGDVDLLDPDLGMARMLRSSLAYDRSLGADLVATGEVLLTRGLSDFVFVNLNLEGPQATDRRGRVLYGSIGPTGLAVPVERSDFSEVIDLVNTSRNHAVQLSARLEKGFSGGSAMTASYTYSRVRDVQTPLRTGVPGIVNWAGGRVVSGPHEDLESSISLNDVSHRVVLAGTYTAPWEPWSTSLSFYYVGESGGPFTYRAWGIGRRGDLNADGSNQNDPIYVPRDAFDADEIAFSGRSEAPDADNSPAAQAERVRAQRAAFEELIERTPCLRRHRGRILERNSCREPWTHTTVLSVRQAIPVAGRGLEAEIDVFNVLDLLGSDWGVVREVDPALLEHVGQTAGEPSTAQPVFRFDASRPVATPLEESAFQLQLALRYRF